MLLSPLLVCPFVTPTCLVSRVFINWIFFHLFMHSLTLPFSLLHPFVFPYCTLSLHIPESILEITFPLRTLTSPDFTLYKSQLPLSQFNYLHHLSTRNSITNSIITVHCSRKKAWYNLDLIAPFMRHLFFIKVQNIFSQIIFRKRTCKST